MRSAGAVYCGFAVSYILGASRLPRIVSTVATVMFKVKFLSHVNYLPIRAHSKLAM
jgi:hypothetical protein